MNNSIKIGLCLMVAIIMNIATSGAMTPSTSTISTFVPSASVDMKSVELAQSAIQALSKTIIIDAFGASVGAYAESVVRYDLVQALPFSPRPSQTITEHLNQLQLALQQLESATQSYQNQVTEIQARLDLCTANKKITDTEVFVTINNNQEDQLDQKISASIILAQCEARHRVTINAYTILLGKYEQLTELISMKYVLINDNRLLFAQYPEVIADPALVEQLNQLARQIQDY